MCHPSVLVPSLLQGATGAHGAEGMQGDQGATGGVGAKGQRGFQGATGPQGSKGPIGMSGPNGLAGPDVSMTMVDPLHLGTLLLASALHFFLEPEMFHSYL